MAATDSCLLSKLSSVRNKGKVLSLVMDLLQLSAEHVEEQLPQPSAQGRCDWDQPNRVSNHRESFLLNHKLHTAQDRTVRNIFLLSAKVYMYTVIFLDHGRP